MRASQATQALLYYDTGRFFNNEQRIDLGTVNGELEVEQTHLLPESVIMFRFDPVHTTAEFCIERFEIRKV
jgi:hypothetical protein